jgi:exodeoxyribonuclease VII large subunit
MTTNELEVHHPYAGQIAHMTTQRYLNAGYKDRELVKALGARWDPDRRRWYVPEGRDLAPFASWLPEIPAGPLAVMATEAAAAPAANDLAIRQPSSTLGAIKTLSKGVSLSQLLARVGQAVAQVAPKGEWVRVEVVKADLRRGHVYLELTERTAAGEAVAQARAVIWANTANQVVSAFERATGAVLGAGIKLLIRARPNFSPQYGLSLVVDDIDPDYTLGDLEAKKREIRARLQQEKLFTLNKALAAPWDFNGVLVVAPEAAAGLGDFLAEAQRLQRWNLCRFVVVHSRFQGEGAASQICQAMLQGLEGWPSHGLGGAPDAIVIIRGGGSVNDLSWLNDYVLAKAICEAPVPVLVGIGHERDSTLLDEVAHTSFDTPSKVIAGIEQAIAKRARDAQRHHDEVVRLAAQAIRLWRQSIEDCHRDVRANAHLVVRDAREQSRQVFQEVRHGAVLELEQARHTVPAVIAEIISLARQTHQEARQGAQQRYSHILERAAQKAATAKDKVRASLDSVVENSRRQLRDARVRSEAAMREIAGQGPEKTLGRGFVVVRALDGKPVTNAAAAAAAQDVQIEFRDGQLAARFRKEER